MQENGRLDHTGIPTDKGPGLGSGTGMADGKSAVLEQSAAPCFRRPHALCRGRGTFPLASNPYPYLSGTEKFPIGSCVTGASRNRGTADHFACECFGFGLRG